MPFGNETGQQPLCRNHCTLRHHWGTKRTGWSWGSQKIQIFRPSCHRNSKTVNFDSFHKIWLISKISIITITYFWIFGKLRYRSWGPRKHFFRKVNIKSAVGCECWYLSEISQNLVCKLLLPSQNFFCWLLWKSAFLGHWDQYISLPKIKKNMTWSLLKILSYASFSGSCFIGSKMTVLLVLWQLGLEIWIFGGLSFFLKSSRFSGYLNHVSRCHGWAAITVRFHDAF